MFVNAQEVMDVTPYENITNKDVIVAQFVIELYVGRTEAEIDNPRDVQKMRNAVIAQTVYMNDNPDISFNQISVASISRGDGLTVFRSGDWASPFIAPLALMSLGGLSWRKTRSIKIGSMIERMRTVDWRKD